MSRMSRAYGCSSARPSANIAVTKSAYAIFQAPPWWPPPFFFFLRTIIGRCASSAMAVLQCDEADRARSAEGKEVSEGDHGLGSEAFTARRQPKAPSETF